MTSALRLRPLVVAAVLATPFAALGSRAADSATPTATVHAAEELERAAEPRTRVAPVLPESVAADAVGEAIIAVVVDARGIVTGSKIKSASAPEFGAAALVAVTQWKFFPGLKDGKPVASRAEVKVSFPLPVAKAPAVATPAGVPRRELPPGAVDFAALDRKPQPKVTIAPMYPFEMKRRGIQGQVVLEFIVDEQGYVRDARVARSSNPEFERPALEAIVKWRFRPGIKNGKPVSCLMQVPLGFRLDH